MGRELLAQSSRETVSAISHGFVLHLHCFRNIVSGDFFSFSAESPQADIELDTDNGFF